jgi:apolipoprotein N-acyltransferase
MSNFFYGVYIKRYSNFLFRLQGFKIWLYAFLIGVMAGFALPPFKLFFLLPFAFATILKLIDFNQNIKKVTIIALCFCFGFFLIGFYWVGLALLHDDTFAPLTPIAVLGLSIILSFYTLPLFILYFKASSKTSELSKILLFSALWVIFEYGRYAMLQFPWNFIGYSFTLSLSIIQVASIVGALGLSFIAILWSCSYYIVFTNGKIRFFIFINLFIVLLFCFGFLKVILFKNEFTDVGIRLVSGNSKPNSNASDFEDEGLNKYLSLTLSRPLNDVKYVVWPEGATSTFIQKSAVDAILKQDATLITGSLRYELKQNGNNIYNSMLFISPEDSIFYYDKNYLVPFGEFVPFKIVVRPLVSHIQDFSRGDGIKTIKLADNLPPFSPLICYEVAFSGKIVNKNSTKPEWILNITNDAWYFKSSGPFQHLEIARLRAIEEGMPLVRVVNGGISAVFNETGNTLIKTNIGEDVVVDFYIPKKQNAGTIFSKFGNIPVLFLLCAIILCFVLKNLLRYFK